MRDLVIVQYPQRPPDPGHQRRLGGLVKWGAAGGGVRVQRPPAIERGDGQRCGVGDSEITDGDRHQRAVLDDAAHRRLERRGFAAAQSELSPQLAQRPAAALVRAVHLDVGHRAVGAHRPSEISDPGPAGRTTVSFVTVQPRRPIARTAPSSGTSSAGVPTTSTTNAPTNQPTARPSSERAGTTALTTRWMGTKASSSAHHQCRHRAGSHGPDTVSIAASIAIQRGSSRNCDRKVLGCSPNVEVPLRRRDAVGSDGQREEGDDAGRRVRAEQLPVPA